MWYWWWVFPPQWTSGIIFASRTVQTNWSLPWPSCIMIKRCVFWKFLFANILDAGALFSSREYPYTETMSCDIFFMLIPPHLFHCIHTVRIPVNFCWVYVSVACLLCSYSYSKYTFLPLDSVWLWASKCIKHLPIFVYLLNFFTPSSSELFLWYLIPFYVLSLISAKLSYLREASKPWQGKSPM